MRASLFNLFWSLDPSDRPLLYPLLVTTFHRRSPSASSFFFQKYTFLNPFDLLFLNLSFVFFKTTLKLLDLSFNSWEKTLKCHLPSHFFFFVLGYVLPSNLTFLLLQNFWSKLFFFNLLLCCVFFYFSLTSSLSLQFSFIEEMCCGLFCRF